jgi:hypothetical protein
MRNQLGRYQECCVRRPSVTGDPLGQEFGENLHRLGKGRFTSSHFCRALQKKYDGIHVDVSMPFIRLGGFDVSQARARLCDASEL